MRCERLHLDAHTEVTLNNGTDSVPQIYDSEIKIAFMLLFIVIARLVF